MQLKKSAEGPYQQTIPWMACQMVSSLLARMLMRNMGTSTDSMK